ncbi:Uncharacterized membrane protein YbhN, UPF0104 family [Desulfonatronum thiosulfatophilum]|uniref:Uncharacterized membrane protein YbhN, UPF0104 family n=1 Tax=Desulfonatronum thiosulfatophilum TaxID=617002 RepID=A0A1G6C0I2_9BACT|nr:lysylphosphatidylglycerol synthase domain-containing protein [Desulfonatronum thiosulfatophilum]SDB26338.1 Uncharacterized membrane protein YbhN, UPF0104 family [Desulfonatronum thiosulfatophilum]
MCNTKSVNNRTIRLATLILILLGLGWVGYLLFGIVAEHGMGSFIPARPGWLAGAMVLLTASMALIALVFRHFLSAAANKPLPPVWAVWIHASGQVVRYLPGRFLGVVYQVGAARDRLSAGAITRANVDLMVFGLLGNLAIALVILGWTAQLPRLLAYTAALASALLLGASLLGGTNSLLQCVAKRIPSTFHKTRSFCEALAHSRLPSGVILRLIILFAASWALYLGAWVCLGRAFSILEQTDMAALCAWYSLAWMVGFAAAITPGGLGVREGAFLGMAGVSAGAGAVAFVALLARFWLMLGDVILWLAVLPFVRTRQGQAAIQPPDFDDQGLNVFDPKDTLGVKTAYITMLQEKALERHLPRGQGGVAVDVGCGYGRLTSVLPRRGWQSAGVDPSWSLLAHAQALYPGPTYLQAGLPDLPFRPGAIQLVLMQNLLRPLLLGRRLGVVRGIGGFVQDHGWIVVVDNIRDGHPNFLPEEEIIDIFSGEGFRLVRRVPLRAARWWMIYLIRYGLIPRSWLPTIADWELRQMEQRTGRPRHQYYNVLFIFQKTAFSSIP